MTFPFKETAVHCVSGLGGTTNIKLIEERKLGKLEKKLPSWQLFSAQLPAASFEIFQKLFPETPGDDSEAERRKQDKDARYEEEKSSFIPPVG